MIADNNNALPPSGNRPFKPGQIPRADDLNKIVDGVNRAGKLLGGGRAFAGGGPNPTAYVPTPVAITRGFWARVFLQSTNDYRDERYYVYPLRTTGGPLQTDQLTREDDTPPENSEGDINGPWPLTATNRAEIKDHTHSLPAGLEVWIWSEQDMQGGFHYEFFANTGGGEQTYPAKIENICFSKGGTYWVSVYMGPTTLVPSACTAGTLAALALPEGMTVPDQWFDDIGGVPILLLAVHTKEDGLKTHWLKVGSWTVGTIRMSTNGFPVFVIADGYARDSGGPTLDSGILDIGNDFTPPDSWLRNFIPNDAGDANQKGDDPVQLTVLSRVAYFAGSGLCDPNRSETLPYLALGMRPVRVDAQGHLSEIHPETQELRIPGCCPPSTSLASASFATDAQASASRALVSMTMSANQ
jgi:hypothetical protein